MSLPNGPALFACIVGGLAVMLVPDGLWRWLAASIVLAGILAAAPVSRAVQRRTAPLRDNR